MIFLFVGCGRKSQNLNSEIKNSDNNEMSQSLQNGFVFSTEYQVEDYYNGYFVVSKLQQKLWGVIDDKGNEVIPLKYSSLEIYNRDEIEDGREEELIFEAIYDKDMYLLDVNGKEYDSYDLSIKPYLGENKSERKYYRREDTGIVFLDSSKKELNSIEAKKGSLEAYYQLTDNYFLIIENRGVRWYYIYLYDLKGNVVWEQGCEEYRIRKFDDNVILCCRNTRDDFYSMNSDGKWEEVEGYYSDSIGIHKGKKVSGYNYTLGQDDNILLKSEKVSNAENSTYNIYKLVNKSGEPINNKQYFKCYNLDDKYFFLQNEDGGVTIINYNGDMLNTDNSFTWEDSNEGYPDYMGKSIYYDKVYGDKNAIYIVRESDNKNDIYRYTIK